MGVVWVINYNVPAGKSGQHTVDALQKRVELLGGVKTGNFMVDCECYQNVQGSSAPQKTIYVMHNTEQPATCFAVLDSGLCLVTDNMFDLLMPKLKIFYDHKKNPKIESRGQRYEYGDFIIKIGSVTIGQNLSFKGILIEVEYGPCCVAADCNGLMKEITDGLFGGQSEPVTSHLKSKLETSAPYSPTDTILQYLEHFNQFKKVTTPTTR